MATKPNQTQNTPPAPLAFGDPSKAELAQKLLDADAAKKAKRAARKVESDAKAATRAAIREARKAAGEKLRTEPEKAADFGRLARQRTSAAVKRIRMIGHLSTRSSYAYTAEQITAIRGYLIGAVDQAMARFSTETAADVKIEL